MRYWIWRGAGPSPRRWHPTRASEPQTPHAHTGSLSRARLGESTDGTRCRQMTQRQEATPRWQGYHACPVLTSVSSIHLHDDMPEPSPATTPRSPQQKSTAELESIQDNLVCPCNPEQLQTSGRLCCLSALGIQMSASKRWASVSYPNGQTGRETSLFDFDMHGYILDGWIVRNTNKQGHTASMVTSSAPAKGADHYNASSRHSLQCNSPLRQCGTRTIHYVGLRCHPNDASTSRAKTTFCTDCLANTSSCPTPWALERHNNPKGAGTCGCICRTRQHRTQTRQHLCM